MLQTYERKRSSPAINAARASSSAGCSSGCGCGCTGKSKDGAGYSFGSIPLHDGKDGSPAPAPGVSPPSPPPPLATKSVTVNVTYLKGGSTDIATHLTKANTVFDQAKVKVSKGKEKTLDETASKAILGDDLILDEFTDPKKPTAEETALLKENQVAGELTMYYVSGLSKGSIGEAFIPSNGGTVGFVYGSPNTRTWPHELGHVLLDQGAHPADNDNFMAQTSTATGKETMTDAQIATIRSSAYVK